MATNEEIEQKLKKIAEIEKILNEKGVAGFSDYNKLPEKTEGYKNYIPSSLGDRLNEQAKKISEKEEK